MLNNTLEEEQSVIICEQQKVINKLRQNIVQLQKMVAERLSIEVGTYYHFAHNLHIYNDKLKF